MSNSSRGCAPRPFPWWGAGAALCFVSLIAIGFGARMGNGNISEDVGMAVILLLLTALIFCAGAYVGKDTSS